jgi:hypothetical protein
MHSLDSINIELHLRFPRCPQCGKGLFYDFGLLCNMMNPNLIDAWAFMSCSHGCGRRFEVEGGSLENFLSEMDNLFQRELAYKLMH